MCCWQQVNVFLSDGVRRKGCSRRHSWRYAEFKTVTLTLLYWHCRTYTIERRFSTTTTKARHHSQMTLSQFRAFSVLTTYPVKIPFDLPDRRLARGLFTNILISFFYVSSKCYIYVFLMFTLYIGTGGSSGSKAVIKPLCLIKTTPLRRVRE
jgi:hypothetical protein